MPDHEYFFDDAVDVCSKGKNFMVGNVPWVTMQERIYPYNINKIYIKQTSDENNNESSDESSDKEEE